MVSQGLGGWCLSIPNRRRRVWGSIAAAARLSLLPPLGVRIDAGHNLDIPPLPSLTANGREAVEVRVPKFAPTSDRLAEPGIVLAIPLVDESR